MKRTFTLFVLLVFIGLSADAQKRKNAFTGYFNVNVALPSGDFKTVNGKTGGGVRGALLYNFDEDVPLYIGAELGYMVMGQDNSYFYSNAFGFTDEYRISATNNVFTALFNLRVQSTRDDVAVKPFVDALFGANDFFSTTTVERQTYYSNNAISNSNSSKARWALAYGGSAGLDIRLDKKGNLGLEVRTSYLKGANTKYLTNPQIDNNGYVSYTEKESKTDMFAAQVGIKIVF